MYNRKRNEEPLPKVQTSVWDCESDDCIGWMRKDFSFETDPNCPLCGSKMKSGDRLLQQIETNQF